MNLADSEPSKCKCNSTFGIRRATSNIFRVAAELIVTIVYTFLRNQRPLFYAWLVGRACARVRSFRPQPRVQRDTAHAAKTRVITISPN